MRTLGLPRSSPIDNSLSSTRISVVRCSLSTNNPRSMFPHLAASTISAIKKRVSCVHSIWRTEASFGQNSGRVIRRSRMLTHRANGWHSGGRAEEAAGRCEIDPNPHGRVLCLRPCLKMLRELDLRERRGASHRLFPFDRRNPRSSVWLLCLGFRSDGPSGGSRQKSFEIVRPENWGQEG